MKQTLTISAARLRAVRQAARQTRLGSELEQRVDGEYALIGSPHNQRVDVDGLQPVLQINAQV